MKTITAFFLFILFFASCKRESFINSFDAVVSVSADSIHFDTVFTSTGSVTHYFKIFNHNEQKLRISDITLAGGSGSYFHINADGTEGPTVQNLEIAANDSLYVFVTVRIDPSAADLPFILQDSIGISYNGNRRWVQLDAWGQNANFFRAHVITSDTTWTNEKPFVIVGGLGIPEGVQLTIEEGTQIFLHADAPIVVDGSLKAVGQKFDSTRIVFSGDRLDEFYRDLPASWPGIYFREPSTDNILKYVVIKNAYQGIVAEKPSSNASPKVTLEQCIIDNCYDAGILAVNTSVNAANCLISNCGKNIQLIEGGDYSFIHCTDVAVSNSFLSHRQPVLAITDFLKMGDVVMTGDMNADFVNCIFWGANGTVDNEVVTVRQGPGTFNINFLNCLWKIEEEPGSVNAAEMINSEDPMFESVDTRTNSYNFRLKESSPAINKGVNTAFSTDLDGNNRTNIPDIGAYETTF